MAFYFFLINTKQFNFLLHLFTVIVGLIKVKETIKQKGQCKLGFKIILHKFEIHNFNVLFGNCDKPPRPKKKKIKSIHLKPGKA